MIIRRFTYCCLQLLSFITLCHIANVLDALPLAGSGISVGNTAQNITVKDGASLVTNVGNSQGSVLQLSTNQGAAVSASSVSNQPSDLSRGNSVSDISTGDQNTLTNNVGNTQNYAASSVGHLTVENKLGETRVGAGGQVTNNLGTTSNYEYKNITNNTIYQQQYQTSNYVTVLPLYRPEDNQQSNQYAQLNKTLLDPLIYRNDGVMQQFLNVLMTAGGKISSITLNFNNGASKQTLSATSDAQSHTILHSTPPLITIICALYITFLIP